jgi:hypothetical protein
MTIKSNMKKTLLYIIPVDAFRCGCLAHHVKKISLDRTTLYPALTPAKLDLTADTWNTGFG